MRNSAIELLRILMMLGIVACHVIGQGGHDNHMGFDRIGGCGVVGFMFISGYFGMKCSLRRALKLLGTALYCNFVVAGLGVWLNPEISYVQYFLYNWTSGSGWWFLWGYLIVMLLAPLVEAAFLSEGGSCKRMGFVWPVLILVFGWQFATAVPFLRRVIPSPDGLKGLSFAVLLGIYVFARAFRLMRWDRYFPVRRSFAILLVSSILVAMGFSQYSSPVALLLGASSVSLALSVTRLPEWVDKICTALVPSLFPVYLIHTNIQGFEIISRMEDYFMGTLNTGVWCGYLIVIGIVFTGAIVIDIPRRICGCIISDLNRRIKVDK